MKVGLLGTKFTMQEDFYCGRFREEHGLDVLVPPVEERAKVHAAIYGELVHGILKEETRRDYEAVTAGLVERGADRPAVACFRD